VLIEVNPIFVCVGCSGDYFYNSLHVEYASKDRGYEVGKEEINDQKIKEIFEIVTASGCKIKNIGDYIFTVVLNDQYTIYLKEKK
jgi:hypothetical protein